MDLSQLKTFVAVARERSITRASELLHLSQPAVSAQIKALEDTLGVSLFERTPRGMSLTQGGERLLTKAEQILAAHQSLLDEATRIKGRPVGRLRLCAGNNSNPQAVGRFLKQLAERWPEIEVALQHGSSAEILSGLQSGALDAGFYNAAGPVDPELEATVVSEFSIFLVAPPGLVTVKDPLEWPALSALPWIYPSASACCGRTAEALFKQHKFRPTRIISVDREDVTRTLIAGRTGVGLLHADTAREAEALGQVELLFEPSTRVQVLFAHLQSRSAEPILSAATALVRGLNPPPG
ncbi:MAG: LysR family transcriptional regulator [Deltaproteobacteria bacterium]|nr:LysR family transcriptional regulator [Deltaproteobacteria bacterium]